MKSFIRRLGRVRHAVAAVILQGVALAVAGLFQANTVLVASGIVAVLLAVVALVATFVVEPVLEGAVVVLQQPQLPDVRARALHMKELAQAS
jgi:uncharacterized membrane protein